MGRRLWFSGHDVPRETDQHTTDKHNLFLEAALVSKYMAYFITKYLHPRKCLMSKEPVTIQIQRKEPNPFSGGLLLSRDAQQASLVPAPCKERCSPRQDLPGGQGAHAWP